METPDESVKSIESYQSLLLPVIYFGSFVHFISVAVFINCSS